MGPFFLTGRRGEARQGMEVSSWSHPWCKKCNILNMANNEQSVWHKRLKTYLLQKLHGGELKRVQHQKQLFNIKCFFNDAIQTRNNNSQSWVSAHVFFLGPVQCASPMFYGGILHYEPLYCGRFHAPMLWTGSCTAMILRCENVVRDGSKLERALYI